MPIILPHLYCCILVSCFYPLMKTVPVIGFGFLQLLVLPGMPFLQLHLGFLLPLRLLLARVIIWRGKGIARERINGRTQWKKIRIYRRPNTDTRAQILWKMNPAEFESPALGKELMKSTFTSHLRQQWSLLFPYKKNVLKILGTVLT